MQRKGNQLHRKCTGMEMLINGFVRRNLDTYGCGSASGESNGYGSCVSKGKLSASWEDGTGAGVGVASGEGNISGSGYGSGLAFGKGNIDGDGYSGVTSNALYIKSYNGNKVLIIDNIATIITSVRNNVAKGYILHLDYTLTPCFVVKENNMFAHGKTLREAFLSLQEKLYNNSTEEERLAMFRDKFKDFSVKYPARELFTWHHILTGSCKAGREAFCKDRQIDLDNDMFTVFEFVEMTKDSYNGNIILKLIE